MNHLIESVPHENSETALMANVSALEFKCWPPACTLTSLGFSYLACLTPRESKLVYCMTLMDSGPLLAVSNDSR